ncbi:hypothetical protein EYF80_023231 [Liparis tanakae]|uniref:Uncharacterized protein n=1 Tax=Liparis tanakae TaxID=230148 RepID=A0A4Z2HMN1_9TELE|nr:hypothetical protein EYF80_023231 [Liparis tanakae]
MATGGTNIRLLRQSSNVERSWKLDDSPYQQTTTTCWYGESFPLRQAQKAAGALTALARGNRSSGPREAGKIS